MSLCLHLMPHVSISTSWPCFSNAVTPSSRPAASGKSRIACHWPKWAASSNPARRVPTTRLCSACLNQSTLNATSRKPAMEILIATQSSEEPAEGSVDCWPRSVFLIQYIIFLRFSFSGKEIWCYLFAMKFSLCPCFLHQLCSGVFSQIIFPVPNRTSLFSTYLCSWLSFASCLHCASVVCADNYPFTAGWPSHWIDPQCVDAQYCVYPEYGSWRPQQWLNVCSSLPHTTKPILVLDRGDQGWDQKLWKHLIDLKHGKHSNCCDTVNIS